MVEFQPTTAAAKQDINAPPAQSKRRPSPRTNVTIYNRNVHKVITPNHQGTNAEIDYIYTSPLTSASTDAAWWGSSEDEDGLYDFDSYHAYKASVATRDIPQCLKAAQAHPEWPGYRNAMFVELSAHVTNGTWQKMPRASYKKRKTIKCKWIFDKKYNHDGTLKKYKARLVARGFTQKHGIDYQETFAPTMALKSFRTLVAMAIAQYQKIYQADVPTAFVRSTLDEDSVLLEPPQIPLDLPLPEGFEHFMDDELCLLQKAIYGLKQAPRQWYATMRDHLLSLGFSQALSDPCIFVLTENATTMTIGVYVDDLLYFGDDTLVQRVMSSLQDKFDITLLGLATHFLSIHINQSIPGTTTLDQTTYITALLEKFGMLHSTPVSTPPVHNYASLLRDGDISPIASPLQHTYNEVLRKVMYAMVATRPDICSAVGIASRFLKAPGSIHWDLLVRILKYLNATISKGIRFIADVTKSVSANMEPRVWVDADFANDPEKARSISGFGITLCSGPVVWHSKKQTTTAQSTAEAEFIAANICSRTVIWVRQLLADLGFAQTKPTIIFEDNQSCIAISNNPQLNEKTAHIQVKYHYIQEKIQDKSIALQYCPTLEQVADLFTKGLQRLQFHRLIELCGVFDLRGSVTI